MKVSFARPLGEYVVRDIFLGIDYLLIRWLEETGYDVAYLTDSDYHLGRGPDPQVAWLFAGHSEYWSWPMWLRATAARDRGISLGFLGGNDIYWLIRYETVSVNRMDAPVGRCASGWRPRSGEHGSRSERDHKRRQRRHDRPEHEREADGALVDCGGLRMNICRDRNTEGPQGNSQRRV